MIKKKAQVWGIDFIIATVIFFLAVIIFFIYSINNSGELKENYEMMKYEGDKIMNTILSEGYPYDWNKSNFIRIGVINDNKINETKIKYFYELTIENYNLTKSKFNTKFEYYFFLNQNITIDSIEIRGIGMPDTDITNISSSNLIKISRVTIYKNKPVAANLYLWKR